MKFQTSFKWTKKIETRIDFSIIYCFRIEFHSRKRKKKKFRNCELKIETIFKKTDFLIY